MKKILYIDCASAGFSGDICLAALTSLASHLKPVPFTQGEFLEVLKAIPKEIPDVKEFDPSFVDVEEHGVTVTKFNFTLREERTEKTIHELRGCLDKILEAGKFSASAGAFARAVLDKLVNAEMFVHHDHHHHELHLHELSSADTFCDIVGSAYALDRIGVFDRSTWRIFISPVALGGGTVKIHHGIVPVPAPATSFILQNSDLQTKGGPVEFELLTPTGSAILATLLEEKNATLTKAQPLMKIEAIGIGAGQKKFPNLLNAARLVVGHDGNTESLQEENLIGDEELWGDLQRVLVYETNLDDVTGEDIGDLIRSLSGAGALDVHVLPTTTKKNRPGFLLRVISDPGNPNNLVGTIIKMTGTLGVRKRLEYRICLRRAFETVSIIAGGRSHEVRVKLAYDASGTLVNAKPEFEDLKVVSDRTGISPRDLRLEALKALSTREKKEGM